VLAVANDGLQKCLALPENCKVSKGSKSKDEKILNCDECKSGYSLDADPVAESKICVKSPTSKCSTIDHNDRLCTECETGYYLKTSRDCATSTADGCLKATYANSIKCQDGNCKEGYYFDSASSTCKTSPISGCLVTKVTNNKKD